MTSWKGVSELLAAGPASFGRVVAASASAAAAMLASGGARTRPAEAGVERDAWTAARLKDTLAAHLHDQRVIVVANREPLIHEFSGEAIVLRHPASGLVTALEPVMRACSGVWIAHGGGSADRAACGPGDRVEVRGDGSSYALRRIWLTEGEERGYYYGFSNEALWPLCHLAHAQPIFRRSDWEQYRAINRRFADAVIAEAGSDEPIVLVQDYHFALVPAMVRERFPRATILAFWHIPWPNAERFGICPYQDRLLDGLLGSSIVGFQTPQHAKNFLETVDRTLEARVGRDEDCVHTRGRTVAVRAYPISVEWPNRWAAHVPAAPECRDSVRAELGLPGDARLVISVDRLDYTKGIEERLQTFERVLQRTVASRPLAILQIAAPSRTAIDRYRELGQRVHAQVDRLNARFAAGTGLAVTMLNRHCEPSEIARYYRAADVCYVSSLHDGMNLVAKEFVSLRDDEHGVLMLSRFAGASRELTEALIVNPYDVDGVADVMIEALDMPAGAQRERMRALRRQVAEHNVFRWAGAMLLDAARLRQHERLRRRLGGAGAVEGGAG